MTPGGSRFTRYCQSKRSWLRYEALEADVNLILEHLAGQHAETEEANSQRCPICRHRFERNTGHPVRPDSGIGGEGAGFAGW